MFLQKTHKFSIVFRLFTASVRSWTTVPPAVPGVLLNWGHFVNLIKTKHKVNFHISFNPINKIQNFEKYTKISRLHFHKKNKNKNITFFQK